MAAIVLAGCGGDESTAPQYVPAAGDNTPMETPGVPSGAGYDVSAAEWLELSDGDRLAATTDFVADNPADCSTAEKRSADADPVRDYADASIGTDYPLSAPIAELLAEGCAAALQSGEQNLAPAG
jgi:hypothetical protein